MKLYIHNLVKQKIIFLFLILFSFPLSAFTDNTIRLTAGEWPPYLSKDLKNNGVVAHIISDIFAAEGYAVEFIFMPWPRAYLKAKSGEFHGTAVWLKTPDRTADFYYSDPVVLEKHVFFHLQDFDFKWNTINDLENMQIGGIVKFSYGDSFDNAEKIGKIKIHRLATDKQNFLKLINKRIDVYPQELNVGYHILNEIFDSNDITKVTHNQKELMSRYSYLLLSKEIESNKKLIAIFNKGLNQLKNNGKYKEYFDKLSNGDYIKS